VLLVAMRGGGLFGLIRCGGLAIGVLAAVFGVRRVVGISCVFARMFGVGAIIMRVFFMPAFLVGLRAGRRIRRSSLDRCRVGHAGSGFRRSGFAGVNMVVIIVRMVVIMLVLMTFMVMMAVIGGMVLVAVDVNMTFFAMLIRRMIMIMRLVGLGVIRIRGLDDAALDAVAAAAAARIAVARTTAVGAILGFFLGLAMGAFVRLDQRLAIGDRNLIIVRMDFAEGQKAVTVAAIFDEGGLQRRLDARDLGEIDVAAQLLALGGLEIKLFDAIAADNNDPGLFRVGSIDQHFVGHFGTLDGGGRVSRLARIARPGDATVHLIRG
jgi:hypothetical protein